MADNPKTVPNLDIHPHYGAIAARSSPSRRRLYRLLPLHALAPLKAELRLGWLRLKSRNLAKRYANASGLLVNLGCGDQGREGWVNVDAFPAKGVNCVCDCRIRFPFPDASARGIFCEHFFEHIDYTDEAPHFLSECHRVLEPGGVIRLIVPDAGQYLAAYCEPGWDSLVRLRALDGERRDPFLGGQYHTKMEVINVLFRQGWEHKFAYDFATMEFILGRFGFSRVTRRSQGESSMPELAIDRPMRAVESLCVEAVK